MKGDWERFPYYFQLHDEIKIREEYQLRTLGTKREGDVRYNKTVINLVNVTCGKKKALGDKLSFPISCAELQPINLRNYCKTELP